MPKSQTQLNRDIKRKKKSLKHLAISSQVTHSAELANIATSTLYQWRQHDIEFQQGWMIALSAGYELLEIELLHRARKGMDKSVFHGGEIIATVKEYDNGLSFRLLMAHKDKGQIFGHSRVNADSTITNVKSDHFVRANNGSEVARPQFETIAEAKIPRQLSLRYYEPERDYQSGLQNSFRPGNSRIIANRDFPAAISASQAKQIGQNQLWNRYQERSLASIDVLNHSQMGRPGNLVQLDDQSTWTIRSYELQAGAVSLSMTSSRSLLGMSDIEGEGGRPVSDRDLAAGVTRLMLFDLPFAPDAPNQAAASAQLFAVAAGEEGWRNADLYQALENGSVGQFVDKISSPGIIGSTEQALAPSSAFLLDQHTTVMIKLHNSDMTLSDADDAQLSAGKNIAMIGQEIVQFAMAKPLGDGRYSLARFYRGPGGTERYIENHNVQENFILFDPLSATSISSNHYTLFQSAQFAALGRGDALPVVAEIDEPGQALRPWQPVHLRHEYNSSGDLDLVWTRRSRVGSSWLDHVDIPLAEEIEVYVVRWESASGEFLGEASVETSNFRLQQSQISGYQEQGLSLILFSVQQRGQYALSAPAVLTVSI